MYLPLREMADTSFYIQGDDMLCYMFQTFLKPFKPEFTIVIFILYKSRIAVAILDLQWMKMILCGLNIKENYHVLVNKFHGNFRSKTFACRKIKSSGM